MCKIKYYLFQERTIHNFFLGSLWFPVAFNNFKFKFMNLNDTKKNSTQQIKKEFKKSKLEDLTNENDFLVKNLKKAGWDLFDQKLFLEQIF